MSTRSETIEPGFQAHVALPHAGRGPGILLLQEIFGVNDYVKDAARRLAELGYVVLAPDLFWRIEPGIALGPDELGQAVEVSGRLDNEAAVRDSIAALAVLRTLPEVPDSRAGVLGFCLGGSLAYGVAVQDDPDVAVVYYGSAVPDQLDQAASITCPTLMHWGGADRFIAREQVDAVVAMADGHALIECHVHEGAGHAFDNSFSPMFSEPVAAARAWELTSAFLARTLPPA
ncbi:MAG: carboxymethylenebutenolidase [Solirubrobacteraceae bacterium]|nr:carboxymethylenebutenolidase [Solirubrobacteraceae bacterium]